MKTRILTALAICFLLSTAAQATAIYSVTMDTSALAGHPAGPFYLEFQLIDGDGIGDGNNTIVLNNFQFGTGGGALPGGFNMGSVYGDLSTSITLSDSEFFNLFEQAFTPGDQLSFMVSATLNADSGPTPDMFSFAILDQTESQLPTTGFFDVFLYHDLAPGSAPLVFASDPTRSPLGGGAGITMDGPEVQDIPEPCTWAMLLAGFPVIVALRRVKL